MWTRVDCIDQTTRTDWSRLQLNRVGQIRPKQTRLYQSRPDQTRADYSRVEMIRLHCSTFDHQKLKKSESGQPQQQQSETKDLEFHSQSKNDSFLLKHSIKYCKKWIFIFQGTRVETLVNFLPHNPCTFSRIPTLHLMHVEETWKCIFYFVPLQFPPYRTNIQPNQIRAVVRV